MTGGVGLVHDWFTGQRGGGNVLAAIAQLAPRAPIYTLFHFPGSVDPTLETHPIVTSFLQRAPFLRQRYRHYLPLFPAALRTLPTTGHRLLVSSSHCVAKSARAGRDATHLCYCHTPMRYVWDQRQAYFGDERGVVGWVRGRILDRLRRWDVATASRVDHCLANSRFVAATFVRDFNGVRVGFVAAVTRSTPGIVRPAGVAGLRFSREAQAINAAAGRLHDQGVRAIVAVIHEGGDTEGGFNDCGSPRGAIFEIERELEPRVDAVLSAHTHRGYRCLVGDRLVIQGASFGRLVSVIDLAIVPASGDVVRSATLARNLPVPNGLSSDERLRAAHPALAPDPEVAAIVEHDRRGSPHLWLLRSSGSSL